MIKKTLYFGNPTYLSLKNNQLVIKLPEIENNITLPEGFKESSVKIVPVEDIGIIILDNKQISITQGLIESLLQNNVALVSCDSSRMPIGMMLPLSVNSIQNERFRSQINASVPLSKQLWQQTIQQKIRNQSKLLEYETKYPHPNMMKWADSVKSGDIENMEARAAAYYWKNLFINYGIINFVRGRKDLPPNNLLNYGYAILRAIIARSIVSTGLLPTIGIHHHNRYNAYCLADDIMEPYRPYVDKLVIEIIANGYNYNNLTKEIKSELLSISAIDVVINGKRSPLMVAASTTTASLYRCFNGEIRKISFPTM